MKILLIIILEILIVFPLFFEIEAEISINGKDFKKHLYYTLLIIVFVLFLLSI